jgi:hypothetical protein
MKTFAILAVSIVLVGILFCPMAMSAPSMPTDLQMVQPDPSLPKELSAFWGKWEGNDGYMDLFYIVEKIDNEKASLYIYRSRSIEGAGAGWFRYEGIVTKEGKKYKVSFRGAVSPIDLTLKAEDMLNVSSRTVNFRCKRVQ